MLRFRSTAAHTLKLVVKAIWIVAFFVLARISMQAIDNAGLSRWQILVVPIDLLLLVPLVAYVPERCPSLSSGLGSIMAALPALTIGSFLLAAGTKVQDFCCIVVAAIVGIYAAGRRESLFQSRIPTSRYPSIRVASDFCVASLGTFWIMFSLFEGLAPSPQLPLNPTRFMEQHNARHDATAAVALALSGGGYRAALMHAGMLDVLESRFWIARISAVSGGAIFAGYYSSGGAPRDFLSAVSDGRFSLLRSIATIQSVSRLYPLRRAAAQSALLSKLFAGNRSLVDLESNEAPQLLIGATDLYSGKAVGFASQGIVFAPIPSPVERIGYAYDGDEATSATAKDGKDVSNLAEWYEFDNTVPAATIIAASGAFPLAFEAVSIKLPNPDRLAALLRLQPLTMPLLLVDGGIADNTGLAIFLAAGKATKAGKATNGATGWKWGGVIISSDGGALFRELDPFHPPLTFFSTLPRVSDVLYAYSGFFRQGIVEEDPKIVVIGPRVNTDRTRLQWPQIHQLPNGSLQQLVAAMPSERDGPLPWSFWRNDSSSNAAVAEDDQPDEINPLTGKPMARVRPVHIDCSLSTRRRRTAEAHALLAASPLIGDLPRSRVEKLADHELTCSARIFNAADTLRTTFSRAEAADLFRMGQYLGITGLPLIEREVKRERKPVASVP